MFSPLNIPQGRNNMKCGYNKCLFDGEVDKEISIKVGNRYYHKECLKQKQDKDETRKLFLEIINPTEVVAVLNSVINNIVHIKKVNSDYLLYSLKYSIQNKFNLQHAMGLYHIINDKRIKERYNNDKNRIQMQEVKESINNIKTDEGIKFNCQEDSQSIWDKITQQ